MVVGEEGTSDDDFQLYLKSEFLDSVFLQQNAFDKVDAGSSKERQQYVFEMVIRVLKTNFQLGDKEEARHFFNQLRQLFIDWNYIDMSNGEFKAQEKSIDKLIKENSGNEESL